MKKLFLFLLVLFGTGFAQNHGYYRGPDGGPIGGGLGMTWIDGKPHYSIFFKPEISIANFGLGINLLLEYDNQGTLRTESFDEVADYLSIIRYVRYGHKQDPFYVRFGALDYATLGHGSIMNLYNNSPSFDSKGIGFEFDWDFENYGFEIVYGNLARKGVAGVRGYVRPLKFTPAAEIPVISNLEIGSSYAADFNDYAGITQVAFDSSSNKLQIIEDKGIMEVVGLDLGLPIRLSQFFKFTPYFDYAKIVDFGSGTALGFMFDFSGVGLATVKTKFERRFNGENYLPGYFNSFYEIERISVDPNSSNSYFTGNFSKAAVLKNMQSIGNGYYGELFIQILNTFDILGSYQRLDDKANSGILHLSTDISPADASFLLRLGYDKIRIENEEDLFKLDDRSYLYSEIGYKPIPYILVSMVYNWTFSPVRDADKRIIRYEPQRRIEPRISFVYPLSVNSK